MRDEVENLPRLARCLAQQTITPAAWIIVDNGSRDGSLELARDLSERYSWVKCLSIPGENRLARGKASVRAFNAGLEQLQPWPDVVVQVDADVSFAPDYFETLLSAFAADPSLGIASGSAFEQRRGTWRQVHVTGDSVWGATRAYRRECLAQVLPLEERIGWDGIDEMKAKAHGWHSRTLTTLRFDHHRPEGSRDSGNRTAPWIARGRAAHYMGYRPSYLWARTVYRGARDPRAIAMLWGFGIDTVKRADRYPNPTVRAYLRQQQRVRALPLRIREAFGRYSR